MTVESFRDFEATRNSQSAMTRPLFWLLVSLISLVPLCLVLPLAPTRVGVGAIVVWTILIWIAISLRTRSVSLRSSFMGCILPLLLFPFFIPARPADLHC